MRKLTLAAALAAATALGLGATPAAAWNSWCDDEPPVTVVTPNGHHVTINNWISVPIQDRRLLRSMTVTGEAFAGEDPGTTVVVVHVHAPRGGSQYVKVTSSAARFQEVTGGATPWDSDLYLYLTVPVD